MLHRTSNDPIERRGISPLDRFDNTANVGHVFIDLHPLVDARQPLLEGLLRELVRSLTYDYAIWEVVFEMSRFISNRWA